jgi:hypothetical protein
VAASATVIKSVGWFPLWAGSVITSAAF